jgi:hypothetical protein
MDRGILLMSWGDVAYGQAAYNLALSIKHYSPDIPIHLLTRPETVKEIPLTYFDKVEYITHPVSDPGLFKSQVYDKLPFEHTLFLDVDALCLSPVEPLFERLVSEGKPYRCFVHTFYDHTSPSTMPVMVWAYREDIWNHFGFNESHRMPATQTSLQYIHKCDWSEELFRRFLQNFLNPIPLNKLRFAWGGCQPDELYLNVTLAELNYDPTLGDGIYFGNELTIPRPSLLQEKHTFLSLFGTVQNIKSLYTRYYDGELAIMAKKQGHRSTYLWKNIAARKHANKRLPNMNRSRRTAFEGKYFRETPFTYRKSEETVLLCTSYFDSGNEFRQKELVRCLEANCANEDITTILNLGNLAFDHPKVVNVSFDRPTYQDFIARAKEIGHTFTVIANSDIYFDKTLNWIHQVNFDRLMIALSRYDVDVNGQDKIFAYSWSQDTWIFKNLPSEEVGNFPLGIPGCDNRFAYEVSSEGFQVINPAKDIKTYHVHNSNVRNYTEGHRIDPPYKDIPIGTLAERVKKTLLIHQPGKVGDIINCLPIAKYYHDLGFLVHWLCPEQYHTMFTYAPYVIPVKLAGRYDKTIDISFGLNRASPSQREWDRVKTSESFVSVKYRMAGVPLTELRKLYYQRNEKRENELYEKLVTSVPYALVHSKSDYGTPIVADTELPQIEFSPIEDYTVFDWRKVIESASEIHCIDSSLANFVDAIRPEKPLLRYYRNDRIFIPGVETILEAPWKLIDLRQPITA